MSLAQELRASHELLANLALREIRGKYKRTVLGQAWSLLNPIAQMATYSVVFGIIFKAQPDPGHHGLHVFALWLSCALLPWLFFQNVLMNGMTSLIANANLIQKVYFLRSTLVIASGLALLFTFAVEMFVLTIALLLFGGNPLPLLPLTLLYMLVLFIFGLGISFVLSIGNVYFRDTQHFMSIGLQVWFYATPIIYPLSLIASSKHAGLAKLVRLNPMERFAEIFRSTMYYARVPTLSNTLFVLGCALGAIVIGYAVFLRYEGRLAEEL